MDDEIQLRIPKGSYHVEFIDRSKMKNNSRRFRLSYILLPLSAILIITFHILFLNNKDRSDIIPAQPVAPDNPIWSDFFNQDVPVLFTIGDHFTFFDYSGLSKYRINAAHIKSQEDLDNYLRRHPEKKDYIGASQVGNLPISAPWAVYYIDRVFSGVNKELNLEFNSSLEWSDLSKMNVIYYGDFHSLRILHALFKRTHIKYRRRPFEIFMTNDQGDTVKNFIPGSDNKRPDYREDYGVVLKVPGANQHSVMIIAGYRAVSGIEIVKQLSNQSALEKLEEKFIDKFGKMPRFFEILYKVEGFGRAGFSVDIQFFDEIKFENFQ